ncbi:MAG: hypothetical protein LBU97_04140 [Alistipes sp.]|nr:hypothetical protein [Alistipes sp.]
MAGALAAGAWFWIWHYDVVRQVPYRNFVSLTTLCMVICFWGTILLLIINAIWKIGYGYSGSILIPLAAAVALWLFKVDKYGSGDDTMADPAPTPVPAEDKRYAPGNLVWARWSGDSNLYLAKILASTATGVKVVFYDGVTEGVAPGDVLYLTEAMNAGMTPHGNWEGKGDFYRCEILNAGQISVMVRYIEDGVQERLPYDGLVFM